MKNKKNHNQNKAYHINVGKYNYFYMYYRKGFGWFRLFGKGLKWKNLSINKLSFSERNGYKKGFKIGKWYIGFLK